MKKILVIGPQSIHTEKFIELVNKKNLIHSIFLSTSEKDFKIKNSTNFIRNKFLESLKVFRKIKLYKPEIIHIHSLNFMCFIICFTNALFLKLPIVITSWGSDVLVIPNKSMIHKIIVKFCLRVALFVTYDSFIQKYEMYKLFKSDKYIEANFSLLDSYFSPRKNKKENIIYSSRSHAANYNIDKVIIAFSKFVESNKDFKLLISGEKDDVITPKLLELVKSLSLTNNVNFIGFVNQDENAELMGKAKIYVSVPTSDAKSISVMEAIASNCVVYASNIPANYDMVVHGVNGYLVLPEELDFKNFSEIDQALLNDVNKSKICSFTKEKNSNIFNAIYEKS